MAGATCSERRASIRESGEGGATASLFSLERGALNISGDFRDALNIIALYRRPAGRCEMFAPRSDTRATELHVLVHQTRWHRRVLGVPDWFCAHALTTRSRAVRAGGHSRPACCSFRLRARVPLPHPPTVEFSRSQRAAVSGYVCRARMRESARRLISTYTSVLLLAIARPRRSFGRVIPSASAWLLMRSTIVRLA